MGYTPTIVSWYGSDGNCCTQLIDRRECYRSLPMDCGISAPLRFCPYADDVCSRNRVAARQSAY